MQHDLKCWPEYYEQIENWNKLFEIREESDRKFNVEDTLRLREFKPHKTCGGKGHYSDQSSNGENTRCTCKSPHGKYTGRVVIRHVTYIMRGPAFGLKKGWVIMSIQ